MHEFVIVRHKGELKIAQDRNGRYFCGFGKLLNKAELVHGPYPYPVALNKLSEMIKKGLKQVIK